MTNPHKKKAPDAAVAKQDREEGKQFDSNIQEGGQTMSTVPQASDKFSTAFTLPSVNVGSITARAGVMTGGDEPDTPVVVLDVPDRNAALTPAQALSIAASLQSLAVYLMEQEGRELHRRTEFGQPAFEEAI